MSLFGNLLSEEIVPKIGEVTVIRRGQEECDVEWKMDFALLSKAVDARYNSPIFSLDPKLWWLSMSLYGWGTPRGYIDFRLSVSDSKYPPTNIEISFSLKTLNGKKYTKSQTVEVLCTFVHFKRFLFKSHFEESKSEFLSSGLLTVVCTLKRLNPNGSTHDIAKPTCSYCEKPFDTDEISLHEKKCKIKCPDCSDIVLYEKWHDHDCKTSGIEDKSSLCEDLKEMLVNGTDHDLILKVADKKLRAHRNILKARSQVFKSMLSHDMMEKNSGVIVIPDCDPEAMAIFLCYIYTGKVDSLEQSNVLNVYYIADKYDMKVLKRKCCHFIKKSLSVTNFCEVIQLALNHTDSHLLEHTTEYFMDNALDIMDTMEWQSFMKDNVNVASELTIKSFKKLKYAST